MSIKIMDSKKIISAMSLLLLFLSTVEAQAVFDITKYGAQADEKTDCCEAVMSAWKEACAAGSSKVLIPKGTFLMGIVKLEGPCKGAMEIELQGTLKAPADPKAIKGEGWITIDHVDQLTICGGGTFDGQGEAAWKANDCKNGGEAPPMSLMLNCITNSVVKDVTSLNSKNFHVNVIGCEKLTFERFKIDAPGTSINTDGIHVGRSKEVTIIDTKIGTGDDCISIGDGTTDLKIEKVICGPGHGISIGSLGRYKNEEPVCGVNVKNCTITGTDNGVRIKSWPGMEPGEATNIHFEDIVMNDVKNPVLIDQMYCPYDQCPSKDAPSKVKISDITFKNIKGTTTTPIAVQLSCSNGLPCEKVELADIDLVYSGSEGPAKSECTNVKPTITGKLSPAGC